jgi:hypothetical protein
MSRELIERLRARKAATAWTIGAHGREHPTHYAPDPDCQDAATALEQQAAEIERLRAALQRVADLDPEVDTDEGFNEWGEACCFRQAKKLARAAIDAAMSGQPK